MGCRTKKETSKRNGEIEEAREEKGRGRDHSTARKASEEATQEKSVESEKKREWKRKNERTETAR